MNIRSLIASALMVVVPAALPAGMPGWVTAAPDNAGFTAEFPSAPQRQVTNKPSVSSTIWLATAPDGNIKVLVGVTDYWADIDTQKEMDLDEKNFVEAVAAKTTSSKRDPFPGTSKKHTLLPSSVFEFQTASGWSGRSRVIVDGNTAYQTVVMWPSAYIASTALESFENSFKLLPRVRPAPPASTAAPAAGK
jgi:hypothetical protein